jgi:hypothetical protein
VPSPWDTWERLVAFRAREAGLGVVERLEWAAVLHLDRPGERGAAPLRRVLAARALVLARALAVERALALERAALAAMPEAALAVAAPADHLLVEVDRPSMMSASAWIASKKSWMI